jgi:aryl-alcohol dehydrogenase-like predicted oxidoreductase
VGKPARAAKLDTLSKAKYGALVQQLGGWGWLQEQLGALQQVARQHGVSVADVAVRWALQQRQVPAVIVGARNASHVRDLQRAFTFELDDVDMLDIDAPYEGAQQPSTDCYVWERGGAW